MGMVQTLRCRTTHRMLVSSNPSPGKRQATSTGMMLGTLFSVTVVFFHFCSLNPKHLTHLIASKVHLCRRHQGHLSHADMHVALSIHDAFKSL